MVNGFMFEIWGSLERRFARRQAGQTASPHSFVYFLTFLETPGNKDYNNCDWVNFIKKEKKNECISD